MSMIQHYAEKHSDSVVIMLLMQRKLGEKVGNAAAFLSIGRPTSPPQAADITLN